MLFLENLMMDSFLLLFVSLFLRQTTTWLRILAASAAGSLYSCIYTILTVWRALSPSDSLSGIYGLIFNIASSIISYVLICMLMIILAFGIHNKHLLMKNLAVLYGTAVFCAGAFMLLENLPVTEGIAVSGGEKAQDTHGLLFGWLKLFGVMIPVSAGGLWLIRAKNSHIGANSGLYELCLQFGEETIHLKALLDTGNRLYDPAGRNPVSIVEKDILEKYLKHKYTQEEIRELLVIPFHSVGCDHGILFAVRADRMTVCRDNKLWEYTKAVIGIYPGHFTGNGAYRAILHPDMVSGQPTGTCGREK